MLQNCFFFFFFVWTNLFTESENVKNRKPTCWIEIREVISLMHFDTSLFSGIFFENGSCFEKYNM